MCFRSYESLVQKWQRKREDIYHNGDEKDNCLYIILEQPLDWLTLSSKETTPAMQFIQ